MKLPRTNIQELLYVLINQGHISLFDFPYLAGFRARLSELKYTYGIDLRTVYSSRHNRFGNRYTYATHFLENVDKAKKVYAKLTEK